MPHSMPGNPFEGTARYQADEAGYDSGSIAQALLTLAYEQRTANLIALERMYQGATVSPYMHEILVRMGVRENG